MSEAAGLRRAGHDVVATAPSAERAIALAKEHRPEAVVMDVHLPGEVDGITAAERIREFLDCKIVFVTGYSDEEMVNRAQRLQPLAVLEKPTTVHDIVKALLS